MLEADEPEGDLPGWSDIIRHWRMAVLDLRRLYGIDLTDPGVWAGPWSRLRPYLLGLLAEPSALVYRAVRG